MSDVEQEKGKPFECEICGQHFPSTFNLTSQHEIEKNGEFKCTVKGTFKNYVILFGGMSDPPPPVNSLSTFGIPPLPPPKR